MRETLTLTRLVNLDDGTFTVETDLVLTVVNEAVKSNHFLFSPKVDLF